jgi:hypothetical protein
VLGIEAAAKQLLFEIRAVLSHDGAYVNDRHLQLLVDVMTQAGDLAPMTRHSMQKLGAGVYTRASFEQTQDVLLFAASTGVKDRVVGVTANIMMGTPITGGSGLSKLVLPEITHTVAPLVETSGSVAPYLPRKRTMPQVGGEKKRTAVEGFLKPFVLMSPTVINGFHIRTPEVK